MEAIKINNYKKLKMEQLRLKYEVKLQQKSLEQDLKSWPQKILGNWFKDLFKQ